MSDTRPEAWLRGAPPGYDPFVVPIVHSLIQAREDVDDVLRALSADELWRTPSGAASVGFHVRHLGGALDRLFTYARGERLDASQRSALQSEADPGNPPATAAMLRRELDERIERALGQLRPLTRDDLLTPRVVGRAALPSTTLGLLFHAAEHCTRHAGQAITTAKVVRGGEHAG